MYGISTKSALFLVLFIDAATIVVAVLLGLTEGKGSLYFKEGELVTWLSFIQLLITAILAWSIFKLRRGKSQLSSWREPYVLWAIIAIGFLFLAIDEIARIHEGLDKLIHIAFSMEETGLTDRIDSIILGCYGLFGIWILYLYREELKRYQGALPFFVAGFIFMFLMVVLDIVSERNDIMSIFIKDHSVSGLVNSWLGITEEIFKVFSEAIFIIAFYHCLNISRKLSDLNEKR